MHFLKNTITKSLLFASALLASFSVTAEIAVIVNKSVAVNSVTTDVASSIFLGKVNTLPDGTKITPIDQNENEKARVEFYTSVVKKDAAQLNAYWSRLIFTGKGQPPKKVADDAEVIALVAANPGMIGYVNASSVNSSVKAILTAK